MHATIYTRDVRSIIYTVFLLKLLTILNCRFIIDLIIITAWNKSRNNDER